MNSERRGYDPSEFETEYDEAKAEALRRGLDELRRYHESLTKTFGGSSADNALPREKYLEVLKHAGEIEYILQEELRRRDPNVAL